MSAQNRFGMGSKTTHALVRRLRTATFLLAGSEVFEQQMIHAQFFDVFYGLSLQKPDGYSEQARIEK